MRANAAFLAFRCCQSPASIALCIRRRRFALLKAFKGAILAPESPESG